MRDEADRFVSRLAAGAYDIAFADPPYAGPLALALAERWLAVPFATVFGIEHSSAITLPTLGQTRRYGSTAVTFFRTDL